MTIRKIRFTDAPEAYDGFGTQTIDVGYGKTFRGAIRKVEIHPEHLEWQVNRYQSGMHFAYTEEEFCRLRHLLS